MSLVELMLVVWKRHGGHAKTGRIPHRSGIIFRPEFGIEPKAGELPPACGRRWRYAQDCRFIHGDSGEKAATQRVSPFRFHDRETVRRVVEVEQPFGRLLDAMDFSSGTRRRPPP
jgi:hypothetical protein